MFELNGILHHVGQLWSRSFRGKEGVSFQYDQSWLCNNERFAMEPALELTDGRYHTDASRNLFLDLLVILLLIDGEEY